MHQPIAFGTARKLFLASAFTLFLPSAMNAQDKQIFDVTAARPRVTSNTKRPGAEIADFDAASIRPSNPADTGFGYNPNPNAFQAKGVTLGFLIQLAYAANENDVTAIPEKLRDLKFDVRAKVVVDPASPSARLRYSSDGGERIFQTRLQSLLTERFHLKLHRAEVERPVLNLEATAHTHLAPALQQNPMQTFGPGLLKFDSIDMDGLASALSSQLGTNVINHTGLQGTYSLQIKWDIQDAADPPTYPFPTVNNALSDQLGLKLIRSRAKVQVLVIDNATAPSPD